MKSLVDQAQMLGSLWSDMATKMMAGGVSLGPEIMTPEGSRRMRGILFDAMSQAAEHFMRSEAFLEMMKQSLNASMDFRQKLDSLLTRTQHEFQAPARQDIDNLQVSMQHVETRILDRLEALSARLDELQRRVNSANPPKGNGPRPHHAPGRGKSKPK